MTLDPRDRFTETAELYRRHRPSYPESLFARIEQLTGVRPPARVIDLGCGTGISTRLLAERGYMVTGVDPNEEMLRAARADGGATYLRGESTHMELPDGSAELITAAQAFHWFAVEATLRELRRVLAPGGWVCAFWNVRAETPMLEEYGALLSSRSDYDTIRKPEETLDDLASSPLVEGATRFEVENHQMLDRDALHGRAWSSSYVKHGVRDREGFDHALSAIFDRHAVGGVVRFDYRVLGIALRLRPSPSIS